MSRAVVVTLAAVLLVGSLAVSPAVAASSENRLQTPDRFDTTTFRIALYENGSATWTIAHHQPLETDNETAQFRSYAEAFEENETELYRNFVDDAETLTRTGTNKTDRQMDARNFRRSAGIEPVQDRGTVRMSFLWTNFSRVYADRVVVSDVFEGGFYIGTGQTLVFEHDTSLAFTAAEPSPASQSDPQSLRQSGTITYAGERTFTDSRPYVELGPPPATGATATPNVSAAGATPGESMWQLALALAVIALGVVAAAAWRSGAATAVLGSDDDGGAATESAPEPASDTAVTDDELLNDDDRVIKLLEDNGGRMKQVDIVETTEWSKSKVSMLLSDMEEEGDISKLRVGRENIISLAGEEPDAAGSPFDEE
ncbi:hypothetical protein NDI56_04885 [Haloarcula sp. S1CR25-12]|uniref:HTH iclR-type domain-containing protein n=1 Tax=Haloarcula saliterrae TaxID=2950534 RepID=A0ABU2FAI0_9EURY|nr:hypothetical protein [Haloarcula sp. S1CR25-12]MDS0258725.1 hypothetical protein [Haloarcula sp. S1CR25-12]